MEAVPSTFELPTRPTELSDRDVAGWQQPVVIDTYAPEPPGVYPAYLDRRVYQGSSGAVYPLPFYERIAATKRSHSWDAVHLDNAYVRLMIIPALGGRIHVALDKITGYDLFFRNQVIKPALIGLTGPWLAGGVEFNWPQHHRPATYLPTDYTIEQGPDGSVTVWCSDHDPFSRMKGMHGVCLRPGSSLIQLKVRLYNRSDEPQTFLWWANVAPEANEDYQSFFPTDVTLVADHAKRAVTSFPAADCSYYGIDYPARGGDRDRLDWYRNIPVPTSYMALGSAGDFFGGYDHGARAGFVHVADHQVSVGKKQWTWGNSDFGRAWCRNLTDDEAVYIELMAGVFTDNQPDFSHLAPGETKVFSQYWYPINEIGPVQQASVDGALRVAPHEHGLQIGFAATRMITGAAVMITAGGWSSKTMINAAPGRPAIVECAVPEHLRDRAKVAVVHDGEELLAWQPRAVEAGSTTATAAIEPARPDRVSSVEELYLIGVHLEQYRHATRSPEPYWQDALRRDPGHAPSATALALRRYRDGRYDEAELLLRAAIDRLTALNPNAADTTASYLLGLLLARTGRPDAAYDAFGRAAWTRAWRAAAGYQLAVIDAAAGRNRRGLDRLDDVLRSEPDYLQAYALRAVLLHRLGRSADAATVLTAAQRIDPLHWWTRHLGGEPLTADPQTCLDVALEYRRIGELSAALDALDAAWAAESDASSGAAAVRPLVDLYRAEVLEALGRSGDAEVARQRAVTEPATWCFPGRLDDADLLRRTIDAHPELARPYALLASWLYAHGRPAEAVDAWRRAVALDAADPVSWRNLGLAAVNHDQDLATAVHCYDRALEFAADDGRLIFERDQLDRLTGRDPWTRIARLTEHAEQLTSRDDAAIELTHLWLTVGDADAAVALLAERNFQPWEGGEGLALRAWDRACLAQARRSLAADDASVAASWVRRALDPPDSLGEKRHPLANSALLQLVLGDALAARGDHGAAERAWTAAADQVGDFLAMSATPYSESTVASVLAYRRLGRDETGLVAGLRAYVDELETTPATIDYFATSLPELLLFATDPEETQQNRVAVLRAHLDLLDGSPETAMKRRDALLAVDPSHVDAVDLASLVTLVGAPSGAAQ